MAIEAVELEIPEVEELETPFKRRIALLVVGVTLLGAIVAYLEAQASMREDVAAREAQRSSVAGLGLEVATRAETTFAFGVYAEAQQYDRRRIISASRARFLSGTPQAQAYAAEAERWAQVKTSLTPLTPLLADDRYAPETDPLFPVRFESDLGVPADVATLQQATLAETANAWSDKAGRYVAILTLLAVSLFLLGLSLTIGGGVRLVFVVTALGIISWSLIATVVFLTRSVPETPAEALEQVAQGNRLLAQRDYDGAIAQYTEAIRARPRYGAAYGRRADAHFLRGNTQTTQQFVSITDPAELREAIADGERAVEFGATSDINVIGNLGFHYFLDKRYARAEELTLHALDQNDKIPSLWLNLGVIRAARGNERGAQEAYVNGIFHTDRRPDEIERDNLYAAARTDLEILAGLEPGRADIVRRFTEQLVGSETERQLGELGPEVADGLVSDFEFSFDQSFVTAAYSYEAIPEDAALAFVWYVRPGPDTPWNQEPAMNSFRVHGLLESGTDFESASPGLCPIPGEYRVDVFAGGRLVGSAETEREVGTLGLLVPKSDEVLGVSLCHPAEWQVEAEPGESYVASDEANGIAIAVSTFPVPAGLPVTDTAGIEAFAIQSAATGLDGSTALGGLEATTIGGFPATVGLFKISTGEAAVIASAGEDNVLRAVIVLAPSDPLGAVAPVLETVSFLGGPD